MKQANPRAYVALITGAVLIGFSPVLIRISGAPGVVSAFYRLLIGTLVLLVPFVVQLLRGRSRVTRRGFVFAALAGLCFMLDMSIWSTGIMKTNVTIPTLAGNLSPFWVGLASIALFKQRPSAYFWFGLVLAFSGVALMVLRDFYAPQGMLQGVVYGLVSGMFYAAYIMLGHQGRKHLDTLSYLFIATLSAALFLAASVKFTGHSFTGYSAYSYGIFIIMGVCFQAVAWFLIAYSQGYLPATLVSPTLLSQPVIAAVAAYFIAGEELGTWQIMSGIVVVVGIFLIYYPKIREAYGASCRIRNAEVRNDDGQC